MGKPTKLTPEIRDRMSQLLNAGQRYEAACDLAGITYQTHRNWMLRGEAERRRIQANGGRPRKSEKPYVEYFDAIKRATAQAEAGNLAQILKAARGGQEVETQTVEKYDKDGNLKERKVVRQLAPPQWTAAAWFLERRMPGDYGKRDVLKIETEVQQQLERLLADLSGALTPDAYAEVQQFVAERLSDSAGDGQLPN